MIISLSQSLKTANRHGGPVAIRASIILRRDLDAAEGILLWASLSLPNKEPESSIRDPILKHSFKKSKTKFSSTSQDNQLLRSRSALYPMCDENESF